jgi:peptide methionine sulfoxide reductase MsrA
MMKSLLLSVVIVVQSQDLFLAPLKHAMIDVWFAEGCFWERQFPYTLMELDPKGFFRRNNSSVTSVAGYAGSHIMSTPSGQVCYETATNVSIDYGDLGYAESVRISLDKGQEKQQFRALVYDFFQSFNATRAGFQRPDPQDKGSPYRTVVGIPGGVAGALYHVLEAANVPRGPYNLTMNLVEDKNGSRSAHDAFNTVFVMDSDVFPFFKAEQYHQFHSDVFRHGFYPDWYRTDLWNMHISLGKIPFGGSTMCPDDRLKHY